APYQHHPKARLSGRGTRRDEVTDVALSPHPRQQFSEISMTASTATASTFDLWSEEHSARPDRRKIRARIGGLHCSLCTGTIEKALGRMPGVDKVAVS